MLVQFTNTALLIVFGSLLATGLGALVTPSHPWLMLVHRTFAWALIGLIPWKGIIIYRSFARGLDWSTDRGLMPLLSSLLAGITLLVVCLGLSWVWQVGGWWVLFGQTVLSWHWVLALAALPLFAIHTWARWPRPRRRRLASRRSALRGAAVAGVAAAGWGASGRLSSWLQSPQHAPRLATGSRQYGSYAGNSMPVTTNPGQRPASVDPGSWRLAVGGSVERPFAIGYHRLSDLAADEWIAVLDCTIGWYATQRWRGVPLTDLLHVARPLPSARFVRLRASTGYGKTFTLSQASGILLATHLGDEPLSHDHGFPLRAVIPSRRGWFWVKWIDQIDALTAASPLPKDGQPVG
jgi:DMSO/TMAO reductase YedYZ molybdopterin-dependent catalytic subunit